MGDGIILNTGIDMSGFQKGTKALTGAIKSLGKSAMNGSKNVVKSLAGMSTQAVKTVASMFGIVGVYAAIRKAVNTYISQNRELSQKMNAIWTSLGNVLGPIIEQLVGWITQAVSYLLEFLRLLGVTTKTATQLSKAANGAAGGLQASLLGFDELNKLSAGGGGGGAGLEDVEMPEWATSLIELLKGAKWDEAARVLADKINALFDGLDFQTVGEKLGQKINGILEFIGKAIAWVDWTTLGNKLADGVNSVIQNIDGENLGAVLAAKFLIIFETAGGFLENFSWTDAFKTIAKTIESALTTINTAVDKVDFALIGENLKAGIDSIGFDGIASSIQTLLETGLNAISDLDITGILTSITSAIARAIGAVEWKNVGTAIAAFLKTIDLTELTNALVDLVKGAFDAAIQLIGGFLELDDANIEAMTTALDSIAEPIKSIAETLGGGLTTLWEGFTGTFAKELIPAAFTSALDAIQSFLEFLDTILPVIMPFIADAVVALGAIAGLIGGGFAESIKALFDTLTVVTKLITGELTWGEALDELGTKMDETSNKMIEVGDAASATLNDIFKVTAENMSDSIKQGYDACEDASELLEEMQAQLYEAKAAQDQYFAHPSDTGLESYYMNLEAKLGTLTYGYKLYAEACAEAGEAVTPLADILTEQGFAVQEVTNDMGTYLEILDAQGNVIAQITGDTVELCAGATQTATALSEAQQSTAEMGQSATDAETAVTDLTTAEDEHGTAAKELGKDTQETTKDFNEVAEALSKYLQVTDEQKAGMESLTETVKTLNTETNTFIETNKTAKSTIKSVWDSIGNSFKDGGMIASTAMLTWKGAFDNAIAAIAYSAYGWGSDLAVNLANGMNSAAWCVADASKNIAEIIRSYIHFTEPDVGPLANFHTYMPDMIDEMVSGIEKNGSKVGGAMADLSAQMAEEAQNTELEIGNFGFDVSMDSFADKIVDGFENLIERLSIIAENVNFAVPSFAGGLVAPYAVGDESTSSGNSELVGAINALREAVIGNNNAQSNLWNIALSLDGQELATKITKIQKQNERARGY